MDTKSEDTIVHQIEKKLSNNINENLFLTGRTIDSERNAIERSRIPVKNNAVLYRPESPNENRMTEEENLEYPLVSNENISNLSGLTRAEYIRQARESCLRQLTNTQLYSRPYDVNYMESESALGDQLNNKKAKVMKLFHNGEEDSTIPKENSTQELHSNQSLMIRGVIAIVLFLTIFAFDKFNFKVGDFTTKTIKEYVTGNDALQDLENIIVTWLK